MPLFPSFVLRFPIVTQDQSHSKAGGLAQTLFFNVCDLPKARFAEGSEETPRRPPWSLREIADSKLRSLRQPSDGLGLSPRSVGRGTLIFNEHAGMSADESVSRRTV